MSNNEDISQRIKQLIEEKNLSVRRASILIDVPQSTLNSVLNKTRRINWDVVEKLSSYFNVSTNWIMYGDNGSSRTINNSNVNQGERNSITNNNDTSYKLKSLEEEVSMLKNIIEQKDHTINLLHEIIGEIRPKKE